MPTRPDILVIDDDPAFRSLVVSLLHDDYAVLAANEGSDGFYKALDNPPHVAVIDIHIPGWDGLKTLKAFRAHPLLADVKVMILTDDASRGTVMAAIEGGANDYVIKTGFSREEFCRKIHRLMPQPRVEAADCTAGPLSANDGLPVRNSDEASDASSDLRPPLATSSASAPITAGRCDDRAARLQQILDEWE